jgi:hypothetical protein
VVQTLNFAIDQLSIREFSGAMAATISQTPKLSILASEQYQWFVV